MSNDDASQDVDMEFIRLFFTEPGEEEIAFRCASRLGRLLGSSALELRPDTTLTEILCWGDANRVDSWDFVFVFEPELGIAFADFLEESDQVTFREMVRHVAEKR